MASIIGESHTEILNITLSNIDTISTKLDANKFIQKARDSFKKGINNYEIADDEKAKLIAQYEAQISLGLISEIIKLSKDLILTDVQIKETNANIDLKAQQKLSIIADDSIKASQNTEDIKLKQAQTLETNARKSSIDKDTAIKIQQELVVKEQVSGEKVRTELGLEQIVTEKYRHRDLLASIGVKVSSNEATKQQAKFEEARRLIALQSNNQNTYMKKADYMVQQLQALAQDDKIIISADQIASVKNTIDLIPIDKITYNSEVSINSLNLPMTEIPKPIIN
ncbi:hypothetical protein [Aliarcobacter cibarius]|uniref:Uncharacterized protein n=1 Tax=Aliarcobacter cibarius TaxID=255507 RepID=A0ABY2V5A3_9BACT|nr:hypothetical protein [Aliarcobacter cibarius]TLS99940.1 hypothetical protein FE247_05255 [Aliarcobacter cibarius]TLT00349.1 hypothetical protein FE245_05685 [Aliarcobacter cibarius]